LLSILREVVGRVSVVTARLPEYSAIRDEFDLVELDAGRDLANRTIHRDVLEFLRNQVLMCLAVHRSGAATVLFFGSTAYVVPILFVRVTGRRTIVEPRGDVPLTLRIVWSTRTLPAVAWLLSGAVWWLERLGYWLATDIVVYTPGMVEQLKLKRHAAKTHAHGARYVDTDQFRPRIDYVERGRRVGYVGRLDEEKGVRTLAHGAARLAREEDIEFTFVGDGDCAEDVAAIVDDAGVEESVELTGWVDHDQVPEHLSRFRLLVMPSSPTEGLPMTALESMACGTPVLAPPVAGLPDVVVYGETGFHLDSIEARVVADRVLEVLGREDLPAISDRCVQRIEREFSFEAAVQRYERILG
jgi:glycosyltransferase involved in cell wall biosynthesis